MKVLLIQPPMYQIGVTTAPNLGLAYIAAVLEDAGVDVQVLDSAAERLSFDEIIERIRAYRPHMIGSGGQTPVSPRSLVIFNRTKQEVSPDIITIAGGPHFSFTDQDSLEKCPGLDIVVRGEAEETVKDLCLTVMAGQAVEQVSGITYRSRSGEIIRNPDREPIQDLDALPFPAWHLFPIAAYQWFGSSMLALSSSRGCPYACPHCITRKIHRGVRRRNPARIVEEMRWVKKTFGVDTFSFHDDVSFLDRGQLEGFLQALESGGEPLYWSYETREDVLLGYRDLWERMKKSGLFKITLGLETPDPVLRQRYGKKGYEPAVVEQMIDTFEHRLDILVSVYLLFGLPEETEEAMLRQVAYAQHLYPKHCSFIIGTLAVPFPGTDMFEELKANQMLTSFDWKDYGFGKSVVRSRVPAEKITGIFNAFWAGTYGRPAVLFKQLRTLFSPNRFRRALAKNYLNTAMAMMKLKKKGYEQF